ncbi:MAG: ribonuclease E/G, partial [Sphingomonadaceae bacterium]|nr:ribonuclease E/G [Sphingomonadaceae bacterium]
HAKAVQPYRDPVPLYVRHGVEAQLERMVQPQVTLKSGGYIIINQTEALVAIDVNSGRSTKEHSIEDTALQTNLEAAEEVARQLRLRDMAGLVVIDFIDMEYNSNVRKVEKAMKDALKNDRARIQVGRISGFGLMEMSRQRLRTGVLEATTRECPHCDGTGLVRTASSAGLSALRLIEDEAAKGKGTIIRLGASTEAAIYLLNSKRADLAEIEARYNVSVEVMPEGEDEGAKMTVASAGPRPAQAPKFEPIVDDDDDDDDDFEDFEDEAEDNRDEEDDGDRPKKRRRRRGGRGRNKRRDEQQSDDNEDSSDEDGADENGAASSDDDAEDKPKKRRRRGGRRRRRNRDDAADGDSQDSTGDAEEGSDENGDDSTADAAETGDAEAAPSEEAVAEAPAEKPKRTRRPRKKAADDAHEAATDAASDTTEAETEEKPKPKRRSRKKAEPAADAAPADEAPAEAETEEKPKPKRRTRKKPEPAAEKQEAIAVVEDNDAPAAEEQAAEVESEAADAGPPRRGWWQRTFGE